MSDPQPDRKAAAEGTLGPAQTDPLALPLSRLLPEQASLSGLRWRAKRLAGGTTGPSVPAPVARV